MSDFTKENAESKGWTFVHAQEGGKIALGDDLYRDSPGSYRAEKYVNGKLVNEQAESEEQLLSRIAAYEEHLESRGIEVNVPVEDDPWQVKAREKEQERTAAPVPDGPVSYVQEEAKYVPAEDAEPVSDSPADAEVDPAVAEEEVTDEADEA